jgi:hypothetical protein
VTEKSADAELVATPVSVSVASKDAGSTVQHDSALDQSSSSGAMADISEVTVSYSVPGGTQTGGGKTPESPSAPKHNDSGKGPFAMLVPAKSTGKPDDEEVLES